VSAARHWWSVLFEWLLVGIGVGCLGVYGYEVVEARRFQAERARELAAATPGAVPPAIRAGGLVGMLDIPRLKLTTAVTEGDDEQTLSRAVGHLPDTPLPWEAGNSAVAGHRDGLFRPLKDITIGDRIVIRTLRETLRYRVTATSIVDPDDLSVLAPRGQDALTLITCYPFFYVGAAPRRFIVHAARDF
jgi:sortase A